MPTFHGLLFGVMYIMCNDFGWILGRNIECASKFCANLGKSEGDIGNDCTNVWEIKHELVQGWLNVDDDKNTGKAATPDIVARIQQLICLD